mmetsp:Transcript_47538/g.48371  ORF Transcript_47538/g.48371 Transcript_47538/m.48371 type:complete len:225 (-) Transcript_47538:281-955(-)
MGPYQNIPAIVINDNDDDTDSNATLSKKHKEKNILYSGMMFLAIVGVSLMLSMKGGGGKGNKNGGHGGSSLTNLRTITDTVTVTDTCPPCDYPTSHQGSPGKCQQVCYNTKEEQAQATEHLFANRGIYRATCTGTFIRFGHLHPDFTTCVFDTTTDTCPPCDYPTSHYGYHRNLCRQVCHNTKEEQTQASDPLSHYSPTACTGTFIKCGDKHPDCKACFFTGSF